MKVPGGVPGDYKSVSWILDRGGRLLGGAKGILGIPVFHTGVSLMGTQSCFVLTNCSKKDIQFIIVED